LAHRFGPAALRAIEDHCGRNGIAIPRRGERPSRRARHRWKKKSGPRRGCVSAWPLSGKGTKAQPQKQHNTTRQRPNDRERGKRSARTEADHDITPDWGSHLGRERFCHAISARSQEHAARSSFRALTAPSWIFCPNSAFLLGEVGLARRSHRTRNWCRAIAGRIDPRPSSPQQSTQGRGRPYPDQYRRLAIGDMMPLMASSAITPSGR